MFKILKVVISAVLIAYLLIFTVNNQQNVVIKIFSNSTAYEIPLFLLVIICIFAGILIGSIIMYGEKVVMSLHVKKLNKEIKNKDNEIERLKRLTISETTTDKEKNDSHMIIEQNQQDVTKKEVEEAEPVENNQESSEIKNVLR